MAFKDLDCLFSIFTLVDIRRGEFNGATIAVDGGFELAKCLIVKDVPVDVNDLGVLSLLMYVLVGFDEIVGVAHLASM